MAPRAADPRMRSQLVAPLLTLVGERGGDPAGLIERFALPPGAGQQPEVVLPLKTLHALLEQAAADLRDPFLGLHLAAQLPRGAYGVVEYTCRSAPTIREALVRIVRYSGLLNELVTVSFHAQEQGSALIEQRIAGEPSCVGRHGNEFFVATLLLGARALSGAPCIPQQVLFAHARPEDISELVAVVGTSNLHWDAGRNALTLPAAVLDLPLLSSDPPLLSLLDRQAQQSLARQPGAPRLVELIRRRLRETLGDGPPELEAMASELKMSARTLQRRLGDQGVSFQEVLDEVRHELALEYVRDPLHPQRPLGEVAYLLGYSELSPFLRAFKRWTGKTPSSVRGI